MRYWKTKYQLAEDEFIAIPKWLYGHVYTDLITIRPIVCEGSAIMRIKKYWCWDGPSGLAVDTPNFMVPSAAHDALYRLIRWEEIPMAFRPHADRLMYTLCLEKGMSKLRAWYCCWVVKRFAKKAATEENKRKIYTAP